MYDEVLGQHVDNVYQRIMDTVMQKYDPNGSNEAFSTLDAVINTILLIIQNMVSKYNIPASDAELIFKSAISAMEFARDDALTYCITKVDDYDPSLCDELFGLPKTSKNKKKTDSPGQNKIVDISSIIKHNN